MSNRSFYPILLSFFAGVFLASLAHVPLSVFVLADLVVISAILVVYADSKDKAALVALSAAVAFAAGFVRTDMSRPAVGLLDESPGRQVELAGEVCSDPETKDATLRFCFAPESSESRIMVTAGRFPEYRYGDILRIRGRLDLPKNFEAYEGGPEFDYVSYLAKDGIRYTMFRPKIEKAGEGGNPVVRSLFSLKRAFTDKMQDLFPEPESSLLGGLLVGDRSSLPKDVTESFKSAGLVHILVLSGYNVTVVAESLMKAFAFLPRSLGFSAGALSIVLFSLMTGASATTVRASIMALIVILARSSARRYDVTRALLVAAFLMVASNPSILAFDVSFELSFLATLGLIYVAPLVEAKLGFVTDRWKLREIMSTTLGTQIAVLPLLMHSMGQVSLISLVTNFLVLPLVPYAMLGGFVAVAAGFVSTPLALPVSWLVSLLLSYIIKVALIFSRVPFASVKVKASAFALAVLYAILVFALIRAWRRRSSSPRLAS